MNKELPYAFLELVNCLLEQPSEHPRRLEDVGVILRNMYHLINIIRPIQARETLKCWLQMQIKEKEEALKELRDEENEASRIWSDGVCALEKGFGIDSEDN
eukprot:TRINITY_DN13110_c0_g1_i9.p4 TRINITY_DN13110_c0_g1~~TRINITY_DN13110_c0_g1_i9.p4  ORF type:complete len:101 (+),score=18.14 TRINITY_DN13110_c0_g1_i9:239-541(+)